MRGFRILIVFLWGVTLGGCREQPPVVTVPVGAEVTLPPGPLTLVFSGDVMQHMPQITGARTDSGGYDYHSCFQYIKPLWESADFAIANLETTLSARGPYSGYPQFAAPEELAVALKGSGIDVLAFANNHTCDRGARGIAHTVRTLDSLGIAYTGAYADSASARRLDPLILEKGAYRVALLNYTYGTNGLSIPRGMVVNHIDTLLIVEHIEKARRDSATHILAFFHWGEEYELKPRREQREMAEWCRRNGVDLVIGSHPHVVQPIDSAGKIVYSLGNFVSNQRERYRDGGISVRITLNRIGQPVIAFVPHWVWTPVEAGRRRYYAVPGWCAPEELGMDAASAALFRRSLEDSRRIAGVGNEIKEAGE